MSHQQKLNIPNVTEYDLSLPEWGPYSKQLAGISHVANKQLGLRFDLSVFPTLYRRTPQVPHVRWEAGWHPWEADTGLNYFKYRFELEWKDRVYGDIAFVKIDETTRLIRCECVNNTDIPQNYGIHFLSSLHAPMFPGGEKFGSQSRFCRVRLPEHAIWVDALDYRHIQLSGMKSSDYLVSDGMLLGEARGWGFVNGSGLGKRFSATPGNKAEYAFSLDKELDNGILVLRYRVVDGMGVAQLYLEGLRNKELTIKGNGDFSEITIPLGQVSAGDKTLEVIFRGGSPIVIDGFAVLESGDRDKLSFELLTVDLKPELIPGGAHSEQIYRFDHSGASYYGLAWDETMLEMRKFYITGDPGNILKDFVHHHGISNLTDGGEKHYHDIYIRPLNLDPQSRKVSYFLVAGGSLEEVKEKLKWFHENRGGLESFYSETQAKNFVFPCNPDGEKYRFSQQLMSSCTLTNVVYPIYCRGQYIKHNTPGRWWDCLYTWDSGFLGLGLLELDINRAIECLNTYLTPEDDPHAAYIQHGTPLPVQIYLFQEIWNRTLSKDFLKTVYPSLRQMHAFLAGRHEGSRTKYPSGLIKTWDHFYNSGGWDDYAPQQYLQDNIPACKDWNYAPAVSSSHIIRTAKILKLAAEFCGCSEDIGDYCEDVESISDALQKYSWDDEAGYFSYVKHSEDGNPEDVLRHDSGANFNMGMDGVHPLIAGICTPGQMKRLIENIFDPEKLWTPIGITAVDQSAPYYTPDGYWNGTVWFPHQWFIWKSLLDLGLHDLAARIATTGLELWKNEVDESYNCFEHFIIESGRGAGWHQFTGLSSPVMSWFAAYFRPGWITGGFDLWMLRKEFSDDCTKLSAEFIYDAGETTSPGLIVVMNHTHEYRCTWNGRDITHTQFRNGTLLLNIPAADNKGCLEIFL